MTEEEEEQEESRILGVRMIGLLTFLGLLQTHLHISTVKTRISVLSKIHS